MMRLDFRIPAERTPPTLGALVARAWPTAKAAQIAEAFKHKKVRVDERVARDPERLAGSDARVVVEVNGDADPGGFGDAAALARGDGWVVVDKPVGMAGALVRDDPMHPILFLADSLGADRDALTPAWELPVAGGGPWLLGNTPEDAAALREAWRSGRLVVMWSALVPAPARSQGRVMGAHAIPIDYSATRIRDGLAELQLTPSPQDGEGGEIADPVGWLLDALAAHDMTVLGDAERGGFMVTGGLRLRAGAFYWLDAQPGADAAPPGSPGDSASESATEATGRDLGHSWNVPADWWPAEPVVWPEESDVQDAQTAEDDEVSSPRESGGRGQQGRAARAVGEIQVRARTIDILRRTGHPWVLGDWHAAAGTRPAAGDLVRLKDDAGREGPWALLEGTERLAARVWSWDAGAARFFEDEVNIRVDEALARRAALSRDTRTTDLFRLIHAEADGLPGMLLDRVGPLLRATIMGRSALGFRDQVYRNILDFDPDMMILEVEHLQDIRERDGGVAQLRARVVDLGARYIEPGARVVGVEDGLKFWCEPWEGIDVGFFADQRDNRRRMRQLASRGERWLNLFCHTGAFSVALVAAGCEVVSVDLSRRYLTWLEENLALNRLDAAQNQSVAQDAREYLRRHARRGEPKFAGIIVDPPTAAASSAGFWSVRKDYEDLLVQCFQELAPGGVMLVCRNDKRASDALEPLVRQAARRAGRALGRVEDAPAPPDYPRMDGFPEGDSFEGLWVHAAD